MTHRALEHVKTQEGDNPIIPCVISDCGEIPPGAGTMLLEFFLHGTGK